MMKIFEQGSEFQRMYLVIQVLGFINDQISSRSDRNHALTSIEKLLLTLRFYASGHFLITAEDFMEVSKTPASLIVRDVSTAIAMLRPIFVKMPIESEIPTMQKRFYKIAKFPRTIMAIDCTHVKIQNPGGPNAEYYRNQRGYFLLKIQTVSCPDLKIMDVVALWSGSCHDYTILKKSRFFNRLNSSE